MMNKNIDRSLIKKKQERKFTQEKVLRNVNNCDDVRAAVLMM